MPVTRKSEITPREAENLACRERRRGSTLIEVVFATAILAITAAAFYSAATAAMTTLRNCAAEIRACELLDEQLELARLCGWDELTASGQPSNPKIVYYSGAHSRIFICKLSLHELHIPESYADGLRLLTLEVAWQHGAVQRTRTRTALLSKYGVCRD